MGSFIEPHFSSGKKYKGFNGASPALRVRVAGEADACRQKKLTTNGVLQCQGPLIPLTRERSDYSGTDRIVTEIRPAMVKKCTIVNMYDKCPKQFILGIRPVKIYCRYWTN